MDVAIIGLGLIAYGLIKKEGSLEKQLEGIVQMKGCDDIVDIGIINLHYCNADLIIDGNLKNLKPGTHAFHIHETGNRTDGCTSLKGHYNPTNSVHGSFTSSKRHLGDLGNIIVEADGTCKVRLADNRLDLLDLYGRSFVIHEGPDDMGLGGNEESLKTGNAGKRIAYGIISRK